MKRPPKAPEVSLVEIALRNHTDVDKVNAAIARAQKARRRLTKRIAVVEDGCARSYTVSRRGVGCIETVHGDFWQFNFAVDDTWKNYSVLVKSAMTYDFTPLFTVGTPAMIRIDSGCESGQKFGDVTCECRDQLALAMEQISNHGEGIIVNIPDQDGRGMGNPFKLATLFLQKELKLNTVEAASILTCAGRIDKRSYGGVMAVLKFLGINRNRALHLVTNNTHKFTIFEQNGFDAINRVAAVIPSTVHTRHHLEAKQMHLGHQGLIPERSGP